MPAVSPSPAMGEGSFPATLWRIKSACPQCGGATRSDGTDTWCGCGCEWTERRPELPASFKGLVTDDDATAHKFSTTQFDLATAGYTRTDGSPIEAIAALQSAIAPEDLAEDGKELRFHITVKYGLHTQAPADVQAVVQQWVGSQPSTSIEAFLGAATLFAADEATMQRGGATSDVLKLDVQSEGLASLNRLLSEKLEHTDTHPTYLPHLTIAYIKPGLGQKYVGPGLGGWRVLLNKLTFSDRDGRETIIDLWGKPTDAETLRVEGVIEGNAKLGSKALKSGDWKKVYALPADGQIREIPGVGRAVHYAADSIRVESVIVEQQGSCLRRRNIRGYWNPAESVDGLTRGTPLFESDPFAGKVMSASNLAAGGALVGAKPPHPLKRKRGQSLFFDPEGIKQLRGKYKRWVTLEGGTHVFIDDASGEVTAGPPGLEGKPFAKPSVKPSPFKTETKPKKEELIKPGDTWIDEKKFFGHATGTQPVISASQQRTLEAGRGTKQEINLQNLIPTQEYTGADKVKGIAKNWDDAKAEAIKIIRKDGKDYIYDGHHTAAAAILAGKTKIRAEVLDLGSKGVKGLLGNTVESAGRWLARKWEELEGKYGRAGALNAAINFLLSSPMPGNLPRIVSIAHAVRGISELAVGKRIKASPFAARYKAMCEQGQTAAKTECTPASGEAAASPEPLDGSGKWKQTAGELRAKHPYPENIAGQDAPAYFRAFIAEAIDRWLKKPQKLVPMPGPEAPTKEKVARAVRAVDRVGAIGGDAQALWDFKVAIAAVADSHENGKEALGAARTEAKRQYNAAYESAVQHIAGLPEDVQRKAEKRLVKEMENFYPQEDAGDAVAPAVPPSPFKSLSGWHTKDWVTMGGRPMMHGGRQEQHHGGTPVELDESGTIRKGPGPLVGKKPGELRRKPDVTPPPVKPSPFKAKKPEPPPVAPKPEPKPEPPPPPAEPKRPAKHQKVSNPKELVDLLASHEVADRIVKQAEELTKGITELGKQVEEANKKSYQTFNQKHEAIKQGKKPGDPEYDKVAQEYERRTNEVGSMRAELTAKQEERRSKLMEALKIAPEERVKVKIVEAGVVKSRNIKKAASEAAEWLNQYVAGGIVAPKADYLPARVGEIPKSKEQRAYYSNVQSQVMLTNGNGARTAVHEIGHHIETKNKAIHDAAHVFLAHRLKGEKPQQLKKVVSKRYDDNEYGRKDDFDKAFGDSGWYVGKHYDHGATEVISMGLEMMHSDPVKLATKDPEYFKFMVAVMDGTIR